MLRFVKTLLGLGLLLTLLPAQALAHGSNFTLKHVVGDYMIVITHNVHEARADVPVSYNFRLYTLEGHAVAFQKAQVDIKRNDRILYGKSLMVSEYKDAELTYTYSEAGTYTLSLRFIADSKVLASADFPIPVDPGLSTGLWSKVFSTSTVVAFLLGAIATRSYQERRRLQWLGGLIKR